MKSTRPPVSWSQSLVSESGPKISKLSALSTLHLAPDAQQLADFVLHQGLVLRVVVLHADPHVLDLPGAGCERCRAGSRASCRRDSCRRRRAASACPARRSRCRCRPTLTSLPRAVFVAEQLFRRVVAEHAHVRVRASSSSVNKRPSLHVRSARLRASAVAPCKDGPGHLFAVVFHVDVAHVELVVDVLEYRRPRPPRAAGRAGPARRRGSASCGSASRWWAHADHAACERSRGHWMPSELTKSLTRCSAR